MKRYRVISPFVEKETGRRPQKDEIVELPEVEGERLTKAHCVVVTDVVETRIVSAPEDRTKIEMPVIKKRGRPRKNA